MFEFFEGINLANSTTAVAAVFTAWAAWEALNTWKRQLRSGKSHEIAWKYLEATLNLREAINYSVRNPLISISESEKALEEYYGKENVEAKRGVRIAEDIAVYSLRWREIDKTRKELRLAKTQAEIWWGVKVREYDKSINELIGELYQHVMRLVDRERGLVPEHDILYYSPSSTSDFDRKLNGEVDKIDEWLRPYIRYEE